MILFQKKILYLTLATCFLFEFVSFKHTDIYIWCLIHVCLYVNLSVTSYNKTTLNYYAAEIISFELCDLCLIIIGFNCGQRVARVRNIKGIYSV